MDLSENEENIREKQVFKRDEFHKFYILDNKFRLVLPKI